MYIFYSRLPSLDDAPLGFVILINHFYRTVKAILTHYNHTINCLFQRKKILNHITTCMLELDGMLG